MVVNSLAIFISNHGHQRKTIHFNTLTYLKHSLEMLFNLKSILHKIKAEAISGRPLTMADLICSHAHTNMDTCWWLCKYFTNIEQWLILSDVVVQQKIASTLSSPLSTSKVIKLVNINLLRLCLILSCKTPNISNFPVPK